jgi:type IV pilus assembly protein PilA
MTIAESTVMQGAGRPAPDSSPDRDDDRTRTRVIPWSGPHGWRTMPPAVVARRIRHADGRDDGYSLIELMVVLLIIGVLLSVAIPTFLSTQSAADDRSAQSNLNTALTDALAQFQTNGQTFYINGVQDSAGFASALTSAQLGLGFKAGSTGTGTGTTGGSSGVLSSISVAVSTDGNGLVLSAYSVPGNCFYVVDNSQLIGGATATYSPYAGATAVTTSVNLAAAGTIGLPTGTGTSYVEVKGDTTKTDCNAYSPKTSGPPATIQYSNNGFPG